MNKRNNWRLLAIALIASLPSYGQYVGDALRFSEIQQTGTARFQGLGGGHAALGGDMTSVTSNPAGLGFYSRSEFNMSGAITAINSQTNYINQTTPDSKTNPNIAHFGFVFAGSQGASRSNWKRSNWGITYSRQHSFQNTFRYNGLNTESAKVDQAIDDANYYDYSIAELENDIDKNYAYSLPAAYYYLSLFKRLEGPKNEYIRFDESEKYIYPSQQSGYFNATGANTQWTLSYAGNYDNRIYIGGSIGLTSIRYNYQHVLGDNFIGDDGSSIVKSLYDEELQVNGSGVNASLGVIYKPTPVFQVGVNVTTPTFSWMKETYSQLINADNNYIEMAPNDFDYRLTSPLRASLGGTFFAGTNGFVTGTLEFVGYQGMGVSSTNMSASQNAEFKQSNKSGIKSTYKNVVNLRLGGEYRMGVMNVRGGLAYLMDPYQEQLDGLKRDKLIPSLGVGYRSNSFYLDLTGSYLNYKSAYTPYALDRYKYYDAITTNKRVNVVLSIGTYF